MTKSIFITGAGAGIGLETARLFASKGWFVGAADCDQRALQRLQAELGEEVCSTHVVDVTDEKAVAEALSEFAELTGGTIDALHNNAGILRVGPFESIAIQDHRAIVEINVIGLMNVLYAAFPYLKAASGAVVVNMSSASAAYGTPDFASYSASKHAVRAMTEALDIEWQAHGIRVCDLMPPFVNTAMVQANAGGSRLFDSLGVNLAPSEVAAEVWKQVASPQLHRAVSGQFKILWPIARSAPTAVTRAVMKKTAAEFIDMPLMVQALLPVFVLIMLGHVFRRIDFPGGDFWPQAERFTYYVLFPAMLVFKLGQARLPASAYGDIALLIGAMLIAMTLVLAFAQWFWRWSGPVFSSVYQGAIRFNSYVGLAAGGMLLGDQGLSLTAIAVAIMVPLLNLLCILMFSLVAAEGPVRLVPVFKAIVTNPLIVGSVIGVVWSFFEIGFHPLIGGILEPLSNLALPMGLMTVGAGLQLKALRGASLPFIVASSLKLIGFPMMTAGLAMLLGLEGMLVQVAVLLAALPTATSAYILARQLGGDAPLMAGIISGQTLLAIVTIPLMLSILW